MLPAKRNVESKKAREKGFKKVLKGYNRDDASV